MKHDVLFLFLLLLPLAVSVLAGCGDADNSVDDDDLDLSCEAFCTYWENCGIPGAEYDQCVDSCKEHRYSSADWEYDYECYRQYHTTDECELFEACVSANE